MDFISAFSNQLIWFFLKMNPFFQCIYFTIINHLLLVPMLFAIMLTTRKLSVCFIVCMFVYGCNITTTKGKVSMGKKSAHRCQFSISFLSVTIKNVRSNYSLKLSVNFRCHPISDWSKTMKSGHFLSTDFIVCF